MAEEKDLEKQEAPAVDQAQEQEETAPDAGLEAAADAALLQATLAAKEKEVQAGVDRIKRLQADFDNFRRRTRQEKEELSAVVAQNLIKDLLPLLDNFERALAAEAAADSFKAGIEMIYKQLFAALEKNGLENIAAVGQKFDPNFHEAIMRIADEAQEEDIIVEELQKGYSVRGRVIRPSMVKVVGN